MARECTAMLIRLSCPACGELGDEVVYLDRDEVACPSCGQWLRVQVEPQPVGGAPESHITQWVRATGSHRPHHRPSPREGDCRACGFTGEMLQGVEPGIEYCPACGAPHRRAVTAAREATLRPAPQAVTKSVDCPECGRPIVAERGKTVICPACNSFLGCLLPEDRGRSGRRR